MWKSYFSTFGRKWGEKKSVIMRKNNFDSLELLLINLFSQSIEIGLKLALVSE